MKFRCQRLNTDREAVAVAVSTCIISISQLIICIFFRLNCRKNLYQVNENKNGKLSVEESPEAGKFRTILPQASISE